jgi:hypothetical protein
MRGGWLVLGERRGVRRGYRWIMQEFGTISCKSLRRFSRARLQMIDFNWFWFGHEAATGAVAKL